MRDGASFEPRFEMLAIELDHAQAHIGRLDHDAIEEWR
jgi:hypothetical protein